MKNSYYAYLENEDPYGKGYRICDQCGKRHVEGWLFSDFDAHACSDECAHIICKDCRYDFEELINEDSLSWIEWDDEILSEDKSSKYYQIHGPSNFGQFLTSHKIPYVSFSKAFLILAIYIDDKYLCPEALVDQYLSEEHPKCDHRTFKIQTIYFNIK